MSGLLPIILSVVVGTWGASASSIAGPDQGEAGITVAMAKHSKKKSKKKQDEEPPPPAEVPLQLLSPRTPASAPRAEPPIVPLVPLNPVPAPASAAAPENESAPAGYRSIEAKQVRDEPSPAAAVAAAVPSPEPEPRALLGSDARYHLTPVLGLGWTNESASADSSAQFELGANFDYRFAPEQAVAVSLRDHLYHRTYLTDRPDLTSNDSAKVSVDEQKIDLDADYAYEFLHHLVASSRFSAEALGGLALRAWQNDALPALLVGPAVGARGAIAITSTLDVTGNVGYGLNLVKPAPDLPSLFGGPKGLTDYGLALGMRFPPLARVRIGYEGEALTLERAYRTYHGLAFSLDLIF